MFIGTDLLKFIEAFPDEEACLKYLADIKWSGSEFCCKKCGNTNYCKGKRKHSRRCTRCKYDESPTSGTMFEKIGFELVRAFHILYAMSVRKKGISSYEIENEFSISQKTCWAFRNKVQAVMKSSERYPLKGYVDVDEFLVGGPEIGKRGRSHGKKKLIIIALERIARSKKDKKDTKDKFGRSYMQLIEKSTTEAFRPFFNKHISNDANVRTDNWKSYTPLKNEYPKLDQVESDNGLNFRELHIQIMNFKGWLRGIHHHCSKEHIQGYLDEYCFRYNRRNSLDTIFHKLVERMMTSSISEKISATEVS
jgi:hypothetical protein